MLFFVKNALEEAAKAFARASSILLFLPLHLFLLGLFATLGALLLAFRFRFLVVDDDQAGRTGSQGTISLYNTGVP